MKHLMALLAVLMLCMGMSACAAPPDGKIITIFDPDPELDFWGTAVQYARILEMQHSETYRGTLLATCEVADSGRAPERPGYRIFRSTDGGETWTHISTIREKAAAVQSEWNPHLYELPRQVGDMPAGTLLCAGISIDAGHVRQTALRIYRSFDCGETWEQYTWVATGKGLGSGLYEPFLMVLPDGRLACYYSDETDKAAGNSQKIVAAISKDGVTFDEKIDIVAPADKALRPGMPVVAQMKDGRFIMVYEICTEGKPDTGNPIHYRYSTDGINWGDPTDVGTKIVTTKGEVPGSAPYVVYVPNVGENGMLIVTATFQTPGTNNGSKLYINTNFGEGEWTSQSQRLRNGGGVGGYSHGMFVAEDGKNVYFVNNVSSQTPGSQWCRLVFTRMDMSE